MDRFYVILMQLYISIRILFHYIFFLTHPLCQLFAYVSVSVRELGMVPYIKLFRTKLSTEVPLCAFWSTLPS